jgi:formylglycine-generating enzyme required for sulfatase activity
VLSLSSLCAMSVAVGSLAGLPIAQIGTEPAEDAPIPPGCSVSARNTVVPGEPGFTVVSDGDGMEMVYVPAGEFLYGEDLETCSLSSFYIDRYEVTNAQFARFVAATSYEARHWRYRPEHADHPAVMVSLIDANAYAAWLGKTVPTEEQWEKAARGTDGRLYPWGNEWADANAVTPENGYDRDASVGSAPGGASPYGALDMVGNVWEWTTTWYDSGSRSDRRVALRGGAWDAHKGKRRSNCIYRSKFQPRRTDGKLGFRCVWAAPAGADQQTTAAVSAN